MKTAVAARSSEHTLRLSVFQIYVNYTGARENHLAHRVLLVAKCECRQLDLCAHQLKLFSIVSCVWDAYSTQTACSPSEAEIADLQSAGDFFAAHCGFTEPAIQSEEYQNQHQVPQSWFQSNMSSEPTYNSNEPNYYAAPPANQYAQDFAPNLDLYNSYHQQPYYNQTAQAPHCVGPYDASLYAPHQYVQPDLLTYVRILAVPLVQSNDYGCREAPVLKVILVDGSRRLSQVLLIVRESLLALRSLANNPAVMFRSILSTTTKAESARASICTIKST